MFFLVCGAAASGKTTVARLLSARAGGIVCHDFDELPATDAAQRWRNLEVWLRRALDVQASGEDFLLTGPSPLGELLTCPSAVYLHGIHACLLDCADVTRIERIRTRGIDPRWPPNQDTLNWAAWHRMHAYDPQWEPHVITHACPFPEYLERWMLWTRGDPRWQVETIDTTRLSVAETMTSVAAWIEALRLDPARLAPDTAWWVAAT